MDIPSKQKLILTDQLAPAARRLLDAIVMHAVETPGDASRFSASKPAVIAELAKQENPVPDNTALRQRLQSIRKLLLQPENEELQIHGEPCFRIESTKAAYVFTWAEGAQKELTRTKTRSTVMKGGHDDYLINVGNINPIELEFESLKSFSVLVSHNWEGEAINTVLDDFVTDLRAKLKKLPAKYSGLFSVELLYDRDGAINGRSGIEDQIAELCERSAMAIFMTSDGWIKSEACQQEARHFEDRAKVQNQHSFLCVQLCGSRDDLPDKFRDCPIYPSLAAREFPDSSNLLELWEKKLSVKDRFVGQIRDEVCEFLKNVPTPTPPDNGGEPLTHQASKLKHLVARHKPSSDTDLDRIVQGEFTSETGDDKYEVNVDRLPAVDTLYDWVADESAESRQLVLLGGFGMGKTTTVQMLHERLCERVGSEPNVPTPIYLDFRRLIPRTKPASAVEGTLADLIVAALHSVTGETISGEDVIDLIRHDKCVVIFDGLDEVGNRIGRDYAAQLYRQFLELIPADVQAAEAKSGKADWSVCKTRLIMTCRTHFFRTLREQKSLLQGAHRRGAVLTKRDASTQVSGVATFYMAPLRKEQIDELFVRHLGAELAKQTSMLIRDIHDLPGLATRPILARFISEVAGELIDLHEAGEVINIATIYRELFLLAMERDAEKQPLLKPRDRIDVLTALARHMHGCKLGPQSADELETWFDRFANEHHGLSAILSSGNVSARNLLHTELENASFLVRGSDDRFSFAHTSYFEYFLAIALFCSDEVGSLNDLARHSISVETRMFVTALAEREGVVQETHDRWLKVLRSDSPSSSRLFAFSMLSDEREFVMPSGANLSRFDLRELRVMGPENWESINLTETQLNASDLRNIVFRNCHFNGANLANSCFDNCNFVNPIGEPKGLSSARGCNTLLPKPWAKSLKRRLPYWSNQNDYTNHRLLTKTLCLSVAMSTDGTRLLTGSDDHSARLWDAASGEELLRLDGHTSFVSSVAMSTDGTRLLTGSYDHSARLWDAASGEELLRLDGHSDWVRSVAMSTDGTRLLTGSDDHSARLWDAASGEELLRLDGHTSFVSSVAMSTDGTRLLTGSYDHSARLWDAASGEELLRLDGHSDWVRSVAMSTDGTRLLTGSDDNSARLWDAASGEELLRLDGHSDWVSSVAMSTDGTRLLTGSDDHSARLWDAASGEELLRLDGHTSFVSSVAMSTDGTRLLTGSDDHSARLWDAASGEELLRLDGHTSFVSSVAMSTDGTRLLTGSSDHSARLWDAASGEELLRLDGHSDWVRSVAMSTDGTRLLTGSDDHSARLWDAASGEELLRLDGHSRPVRSVAMSTDGTRLLTGSDDHSARLWDAASGEELLRLDGHSRPVSSVAMSTDGTRLLTGSDDHSARLWDAASGEELLRLDGHSRPVRSVAMSTDGTRLLTGSYDHSARLWDAASGEELLRLDGHTSFVSSVAMSTDGTRLLTGSDDHSARLWDAASGEELLRLDGHSRPVRSVAMSTDGTRLLTGSDDHSARLWDAASGEELLRLVGMPESWAVLDADSRVKKHGPEFWRYVA